MLEPSTRESRDSGVGGESGTPVSIDRRLFRRLRKPKTAEVSFKPPERMHHQEKPEKPFAFEDFGAVPFGAKVRQRLAGNGLEDLSDLDRFDFRDEGAMSGDGMFLPWEGSNLPTGFLTLGSSDEFPGEAHSEPVAGYQRERSSPALQRHNDWLDGRPEEFSSDGLARLDELDLSPGRRTGRLCDPGDDLGFASEHLRGNSWMTASRRSGPRKSDPVTRGAQLRDLWSRDRFLRSSGTRKFDLRGCGPPAEVNQDIRRYNRRLSAPHYVALHHKRGDEEQYQVRRQMRVGDYR